jgi:hypothetical protein
VPFITDPPPQFRTVTWAVSVSGTFLSLEFQVIRTSIVPRDGTGQGRVLGSADRRSSGKRVAGVLSDPSTTLRLMHHRNGVSSLGERDISQT